MKFDYDEYQYQSVAREIVGMVSQLFDDPVQAEKEERESLHGGVGRLTDNYKESDVYKLVKQCTRESIKEANETFYKVVMWRAENFLSFEAAHLAETLKIYEFDQAIKKKEFKYEFKAIFIAVYFRIAEELSQRGLAHQEERSKNFRIKIALHHLRKRLKDQDLELYALLEGYISATDNWNPFDEYEYGYIPLSSYTWRRLCNKIFYRAKGSFTICANANSNVDLFKKFMSCYKTISQLAKRDCDVIFSEYRSKEEIFRDLGVATL